MADEKTLTVNDLPRFFKLTLSSKETRIMSEKAVEDFIKNPQQIVVIRDDKGKITAYLNKAHVVSILYDKGVTKEQNGY